MATNDSGFLLQLIFGRVEEPDYFFEGADAHFHRGRAFPKLRYEFTVAVDTFRILHDQIRIPSDQFRIAVDAFADLGDENRVPLHALTERADSFAVRVNSLFQAPHGIRDSRIHVRDR
ncbi:MAG: hypothetical protein F4X09_03370 [Gammaproteobacteria bacterium]|nr:hypothetical protein [Gammaproteobacteria bacterium]MYC59218.1 hypothetical protein [Gammaproteobacteria bacterium]MYH45567.1 hypothetical protein [Gammaproteobacteria bacterium]